MRSWFGDERWIFALLGLACACAAMAGDFAAEINRIEKEIKHLKCQSVHFSSTEKSHVASIRRLAGEGE